MSKLMTVTYYHHSGFSVSSGDVLLVFDYWTGKAKKMPEEYQIKPDYLSRFNEVYVFVSHEHEDHYDPVIYTWEQYAPVTYIIADDIEQNLQGRRIGPGGKMTLSDHVSVTAFGSTDAGVSFLVDLDGVKFFHAGDLNFWHWREVSSAREIDIADRDFRTEVEPIIGEEIDWCFFPVDPRMGMHYDAGASYFMMAVKPRVLTPMHFWGRSDVIHEYARRSRTSETEIVPLTEHGQAVSIVVDDEGFMDVTMRNLQPETQGCYGSGTDVSLDGYEGADPFHESDLPVEIDEADTENSEYT